MHRSNQRNSTCQGRATERGPCTLGLFPPWKVTATRMSHGNGGRIIPLMLKTEAWDTRLSSGEGRAARRGQGRQNKVREEVSKRAAGLKERQGREVTTEPP